MLCCSLEKSGKMENKRFKEADNIAVFTTKFVIVDNKVITTVTYEKEDGAWQFISNDPFDNFESVAQIVGLGEMINIDSTLLEIADLPEGFRAYRKFKGDKWIIQEIK